MNLSYTYEEVKKLLMTFGISEGQAEREMIQMVHKKAMTPEQAELIYSGMLSYVDLCGMNTNIYDLFIDIEKDTGVKIPDYYMCYIEDFENAENKE